MKNITLSLIVFLSFLSCQNSENYDKKEVSASLINIQEETPPPPPNQESKNEIASAVAMKVVEPEENSLPPKIENISQKIIKNGDMEIEVGNIKTAKEKIIHQIKNLKGYTQDEFFNNGEMQETVKMTIRIPNENFDKLLNSFSDGIGTVISKNVSIQDVTEEYTDVSIRLKNKLIYLEKYRDLLRQANKTSDILEIQENIRNLEEEIESSEGRLRFIDDKVKYSTLELTILKQKPRNTVTSKIGFGSRFVDSLAEGWNSFVNFLLGIVTFWPFFITIPFIIFLFKRWRKKRNENQ